MSHKHITIATDCVQYTATVKSDQTQRRTCLNCDESVDSEFCSHCGQCARIGRLRLRELLSIAAAELLELEGPIARTIIGLTIRPGRVCLEFVEGCRRRYVNPIKYLLVSAAIYVFIVRVILKRDLGAGMAKLMGMPDPADLAATNQGTKDAMQFAEWMQDSINLIAILFVPVFAAILMVLFWNNGSARRPRRLENDGRSYHRNYAEHCVFALYVTGHQYILSLIPSALDCNADPIGTLLLQFLLPTVYYAWAALSFYGRGLFATTWRIVVLQIAFFATTSLFSMVAVIAYTILSR